MSIVISLFVLAVLIFLPIIGVEVLDWQSTFAIYIPYVAIAIFLLGMLYRMFRWAKSAVPFRIPTTCGQHKSLPWIKGDELENPSNNFAVVGRMLLEILLFRSLWRNQRFELEEDRKRLRFDGNRYLWLAGLAFHWSLFIIIFRHANRILMNPEIPYIYDIVNWFDTILQPFDIFFTYSILYITDLVIVVALTFLFFRRIVSPQMRYISLLSDYFALLLIGGVAISGILMAMFWSVDFVNVKELAIGVLSFDPDTALLTNIGLAFYVHITLICALLIYFPFSKMVHLGGVFLSPTRNLANTNRVQRHVNPWDYPVEVHTYQEYEDEFREYMKKSGLPLEKE
jgi:nitrate reductase gamma subunit